MEIKIQLKPVRRVEKYKQIILKIRVYTHHSIVLSALLSWVYLFSAALGYMLIEEMIG